MKAIVIKNRILFFLISLLGLWRYKETRTSLPLSNKRNKGGVFYYYPKFNIYYSMDDKKWYIKKGFGWLITTKLPKEFPLIRIILSKIIILNCSGSTPFCYDRLKFETNKKILKPEILKLKRKAKQYYLRQQRFRFRYLSLKDCNYKFSK